MSVLRVIRAQACPEIAWKNGGGTTREIAVFPPGAGMEDFLWRLSMAKVEKAGTFSTFESIDRILTVIEGTLRLSGPTLNVTLDCASNPFPFDGAALIIGEPLTGPVLDLNAMVRRGSHSVTVKQLKSGDIAACKGTSFIVALERQYLGETCLNPLDCAQIEAELSVQGDVLHVDFVADRRVASYF